MSRTARKTEKQLSNNGQFPPRVRFNWGFWDGLNAVRTPEWYRPHAANHGHYDASYAAGWYAGHMHRGERPTTSDAAWNEHKAA